MIGAMNPADEKAIRQGIEVAERQLAEIDAKLAEIEALRQQRGTLEAYIQHAKSLLGERVEKSGALEVALRRASELFHNAANPIWADAAPILSKAQRPMTVPEIVEQMKTAGRQFGAVHVTEVVRAALNRRPDVFENLGKGRYALKRWPKEWKERTEGGG